MDPVTPEASQPPVLIQWQSWAITNQKRLRLWGGASAIGLVAIIIFFTLQSQKEARASAALSDIKVPLNHSTVPDPGTSDAYLAVVKEFPGTRAAGRAMLLAGSVFYMEGKFAEAQAQFETFLTDYSESPWLSQASFGVAGALDAQKKTAEAIVKYEEVRRRFATFHVAEESRLCLGRLYEQENRVDEAFQIYDELVKAHPGAGIGAEAGLRREDLMERFPQLAKTNAPAINPLIPTPGLPNIVAPAPPALPAAGSNLLQTVITNATGAASNLIKQLQVNPPQPPPAAAAPAPAAAPVIAVPPPAAPAPPPVPAPVPPSPPQP